MIDSAAQQTPPRNVVSCRLADLALPKRISPCLPTLARCLRQMSASRVAAQKACSAQVWGSLMVLVGNLLKQMPRVCRVGQSSVHACSAMEALIGLVPIGTRDTGNGGALAEHYLDALMPAVDAVATLGDESGQQGQPRWLSRGGLFLLPG